MHIFGKFEKFEAQVSNLTTEVCNLTEVGRLQKIEVQVGCRWHLEDRGPQVEEILLDLWEHTCICPCGGDSSGLGCIGQASKRAEVTDHGTMLPMVGNKALS